jgi:amino acid adenylation domain-containing protein
MNSKKQIEDIYPLSPMQQGILYHALLENVEGNSSVYIPQIVISLTGLVDVSIFKAAWQQVVENHSILRTAFQWEQRDQPFQVVYRQVALPWQQQDWRSLPVEQRNLDAFLERDRQQGFNLKTAPLMRLMLIQIDDSNYYLVWTQHHLILDGWSAGLLLKQVFEFYQQQVPPPSRPYRDYIAWLQAQDISAAQAFWKTRLQGFTAPTVVSMPPQTSTLTQWNEQQHTLTAAATAALKSIAQQHHFTLNTLLQAAFGLLLSYYTNETDVVFGATVAGRPATLSGSESMVGLFINTLPVRLQIPMQENLILWLQQVQMQQAETLQYDYTPLLDIQGWSDMPRGTPLFESILVFENYPIDPKLLQSQAGLRLTEVHSVEWTSFPLTLLVSAADQVSLKLKFDQQRFDPAGIARLLNHLETLLNAIAANPHQRIADLPFLTSSEQQQLYQWNKTAASYPQNCIHHVFETQCERTPDATAVVFESHHLTYAQLNIKANQLAHYLLSIGVQPETSVGIYLDRSLEMAIAILAVVKIGAAYVPLDPTYPVERLEFMLADAQAKFILSHSTLASRFDAHIPLLITLNTISDQVTNLSTANLNLPTFPDQSLYVIYTSGSTGQPKGVINTHRGLANRLNWMQQEYRLMSEDRVLQKTPFSFDVSVWEFFWTWLNGACLVIAAPNVHQDSVELVRLIREQQITTVHFVPSMLQIFLEEPRLSECTSLQRIICSGEALSIDLARRCLSRLPISLHNLYGPTEAAIDVSYFTIEHPENLQSSVSIPIGKPIANIKLYILDSHLRLVPIGIPGELYIAGVGVARGYLNRPDLTAERFIPNPFVDFFQSNFSAFSRLYKTGDRACYLPDGNIQFLGRNDDQIKLRGFRIELGEIAALLAQHPAIQQAAVTLTPTPQPHITAFLVSPTPTPTVELIAFLQPRLPEFMIPSAFVWLEALPLTPNGKLDRASLAEHARQTQFRQKSNHHVSPRNPTEATVAAVWAEVLRLEQISVEDSFFELGGNSLLATRINSRLRQAFQLDIPLRNLLEKPTVAALAERIEVMQKTVQQLETPVPKGRKEIEL